MCGRGALGALEVVGDGIQGLINRIEGLIDQATGFVGDATPAEAPLKETPNTAPAQENLLDSPSSSNTKNVLTDGTGELSSPAQFQGQDNYGDETFAVSIYIPDNLRICT